MRKPAPKPGPEPPPQVLVIARILARQAAADDHARAVAAKGVPAPNPGKL